MINCIAIDDEPLALRLLQSYILRTPFLNLCGLFSNAEDALEEIYRQNNIQLIFCDIHLTGISGITFTQKLNQQNHSEQNIPLPKVIFTTAYAEYAIEGFKLQVIHYLLKPFTYEDFFKSAEIAKKQIELEILAHNAAKNTELPENIEPNDFIFVKSEYQNIRIDVADIIYVEGLKDYIKIHLKNTTHPILTLNTLKGFETLLPQKNFIRIHRSYIINTTFVQSVTKQNVTMQNPSTAEGTAIPIGVSYKNTYDVLLNL